MPLEHTKLSQTGDSGSQEDPKENEDAEVVLERKVGEAIMTPTKPVTGEDPTNKTQVGILKRTYKTLVEKGLKGDDRAREKADKDVKTFFSELYSRFGLRVFDNKSFMEAMDKLESLQPTIKELTQKVQVVSDGMEETDEVSKALKDNIAEGEKKFQKAVNGAVNRSIKRTVTTEDATTPVVEEDTPVVTDETITKGSEHTDDKVTTEKDKIISPSSDVF